MPKRLIVCRHGYRQDWDPIPADNDSKRVGDNYLSAYGKSQAESLANHLKGSIPSTSRIVLFVSPYLRTLQTAEPISREFNVPIRIEPGFRENFDANNKNAKTIAPLSPSGIIDYFPHLNIDLEYTPYQNIPDLLVTTKAQFVDRLKIMAQNVVEEFDLLSNEEDDDEDLTVICVTHAATKIMFVRAVAGITGLESKPDETDTEVHVKRRRNSLTSKMEVRCGVASATILTPQLIGIEGVITQVVEWNSKYETSYLEQGEMRNWTFPDEIAVAYGKAA